MSEQRIGTCSLCGGEVVGYRGAWMAVIPPPPDHCTSCGALRAVDVIEMVRPGLPPGRKTVSITSTGTYSSSRAS